MSLSARRAWIEISSVALLSAVVAVALRKESVDRNFNACGRRFNMTGSLSARRAWIEIHPLGILGRRSLVALRKESVDRNWLLEANIDSG